MTEDDNIVITSAARTAIGTFCGSLKDMQAQDLGALVVKAVIEKSNLTKDSNPSSVKVIVGTQIQ